jgi:arylsulfatase A-like enzyme
MVRADLAPGSLRMSFAFRPAGRRALACASLAVLAATLAPARAAERPPNILLIVADDLGYGDLGPYGQGRIATPNLDRLAAQGVRFTRAYAGSTVCAPSRCALMTGLHTGHARIRGNARVPLEPGDVTVAEVLKSAGYATGLVGKWGLGEPDSTGVPNRQGFDTFFGYLNQQHAHNYYPDHLWRDEIKEPLAGNRVGPIPEIATERTQYAPDLFTREAIRFLETNRERPWFLYLATILPHANNERGREEGNGMEIPPGAPERARYADEPWPQPQKDHAAMITKLDAEVGKVLDALDRLGLADTTLVLFTSDNGPHKEGGADPAFFGSSGPLRGYKRSLHDGGIRVPALARWPGHIRAGTTSDQVWAFWDVLPTFADLVGAKIPEGVDGISLAATLRGEPAVVPHPPLYWEFLEGGFAQAALMEGRWKGLRPAPGAPVALYDMDADPGETTDLAAQQPAVAAAVARFLDSARTDSPDFPIRPAGARPKAAGAAR